MSLKQKVIVMRRWYLKELMMIVFNEGEHQGCYEVYTADCSQGAILTQLNCQGKAPQTNSLCVSGVNCGDTPLTKSVEAGQHYKFSVKEKDFKLESGTVEIKVIDAWTDDTGVFEQGTPAPGPAPPMFLDHTASKAGVTWALFLVFWRCL